MLFSIIVPVHNGERYLGAALDSALALDTGFYSGEDPLYEIIVVENGSKDRTGEICNSYSEKNDLVRVIFKGPVGLYSARQIGIKAAKGKWIIALDADDILDPGMLKALYPYVLNADKEGSEADVIYFDAARFEDKKSILFSHPFVPGKLYKDKQKKAFYDVLCAGDSLNTMWTKCIRKDMAYLGREDLYLNYGEDLYQTVQYLDRAKGIIYLKETLYYYRRTGESISFMFSDFYLDNQKTVWKMVDEISCGWNDPDHKRQISERKSLTCSIVVAKLIYSELIIRKKLRKYREITADAFYRECYRNDLPKWAPEESVYVHRLQTCKNSDAAVIKAIIVFNIKMHVKRFLRLLKK